MANFVSVATQFAEWYYGILDRADRSGIGTLYRAHSMMTFETHHAQGSEKIEEKIKDLPFQKLQHQIATLDAQPSGESGSIIVLITGELKIDESEHSQKYSQCFHLIPEGGTYYVLNDIFKLVYG